MRIITVARKPIAGSVAQTVLKYGTGGLNIDECRIGYASDSDKASAIPGGTPTARVSAFAGKTEDPGKQRVGFIPSEQKGRWPANLILIKGRYPEECPIRALDALGETTCGSNNMKNATGKKGYSPTVYGAESRTSGKEEVSYGDSGSVARYFKQIHQDLIFLRASGDVPCPICGKTYIKHPEDAEYPYLNRLCDGTLVKL